MTDVSTPIAVHVSNLSDVKNWAVSAKPPYVRKSTFRTIIVDPAGTGVGASQNSYVQIAAYEPNRYRTFIQVLDAAVMLLNHQPNKSPDVSSTTTPGDGIVLLPTPNTGPGFYYEFFGPDPLFLNALATITRVSIVMEHCE